ncbi:unnamed protein product [Calypogeia fissa]
MPTDGEAGENRTVTSDGSNSSSPRPQVVTRQDSKLSRQDSKLTRQDSKRKETGATTPGDGAGGGEGRLGQFMESSNNGLKNSGLFGFVQYFMDRPDSSLPTSGASSPAAPPVAASPIQVPVLEASHSGRSSQRNSNSPGGSPDPEIVKNEVFSDGNKSDRSEKSDAQRSDSRLELQTSQSSRTFVKSEEYRQLFHLPPEEALVEDFNCALQKKILLQGHMYLFERYVCFYSNIFGYEKKKVIPLKDITCVRKAKTAGVFPNAIEITSWGKKHFFASFLSRDEAYRLIINGWSQHSGYARIFLGSHYSPMSSPPSQGRNSIDSGGLSSSWRSPQRAASIQPEETDTPRTMEEGPSLEAPSSEEVRDVGTLEEPTEPRDGENSAEGVPDERLSINESSSISTSSVSPLWDPEDSEAPGMPEGYKTLVESEFAVDVEEFFQLFFSDDAVGFFKAFHTKCGDDDFRCKQWAKHRHFGHARDISFRHPINFYFGPKSTYCHESQRFRVYRNSHLVLETSQQMTDIPYGDYFRVEVRWDVYRLCGKGSYHCFVRVSLGINFLKKTVWKGKIEQGTHDESKEAYTTWIQEAHSVLREIQALAVEAGTAENTTTAPSSDTGEHIREMVTLDDPVLAEVEQPVRRVQDENALLKTSSKVGSRGSRIKEGLRNHKWKKKGSAIIETLVLTSQKIWDKSYNMDFRSNKQLQLVCFILIGIIIVLMQVGIMIALARPQKVQYVGVGYSNNQSPPGSCFGGSKGDEALAWLEQRARHVKEEIIMAEARLQTLHQDLAVLKSHAGHLLSYVVESQYKPQQTSTE